MEKKIEEMKTLNEKLREAAKAYYQDSTEIMSNYDYDKLYDELVELEKETKVILGNSVTQNVGYEILSSLKKVKHPSKMLSLDKTKDKQVLADWLKDKEGFLSWKLDGLTVVLTYIDGKLDSAVTRGTGEIGELITENAKFFHGVPISIPHKNKLVIRGEAIISYSEFERINKNLEGRDLYKNPRNLCSGTVRQLNTEITASRKVEFIPFTVVEGMYGNSYSERLNNLKEYGFHPVEGVLTNKDDIEAHVGIFSKKIQTNDFPSDGLVLFFDDVQYGESLGTTSKFPRNGIAFKWEDETEETVLRDIEWSASRTGLLNPVAIFDPVELEGTTVSRASVHNISIMEKLKLNIGDTLTCYKANMIIPQIGENKTGVDFDSSIIPTLCPVCGGKTTIKEVVNPSTKETVKTIYCENEKCAAKHIGSFEHFACRDAMNIVGLSESTLEKFISLGILHDFVDLYHLSEHEEQIKEMEGFGERSYTRLINAIEKSRDVDIDKFLYSLGLDNIGRSASKLIMKTMDSSLEKLQQATKEELSNIDGIGEVMADTIISYFQEEENVLLLNKLLAEVRIIPIKSAEESNISGMTFVITGTLVQKSRSELKEYIESKGAKVSGSVSSKTNYLINNDNMSNSSKNKKAKDLGVKIITEDQFYQL